MFKHVREREDSNRERARREEEAQERAYQKANIYQRNMFDAFNGAKYKIGGKSVWFECEFTKTDVRIKALCFNYEFKLFESHNSFENDVKALARKKTNNIGYNGCPTVYFVYC